MVGIQANKKRVRVVNPQRKKRRSRNPLVTLGAVNPQKRGTMPKKAKKKNPTAAAQKKRRRSNPVIKFVPVSTARNGKKKNPHRRRKNPNFNVWGSATNLLESGGAALVGLVATRQIPQMLLKGGNTGWKGYLANAATALAASYAAGKMVGPAVAGDVLVGGGLYLVNRIITEKFSPIGQAFQLSGTGDAAAASSMGRVRVGYFPLPVQRDARGNPIIPQAMIDAVKAQLPAPAASKVSGISSRMAGRFAA